MIHLYVYNLFYRKAVSVQKIVQEIMFQTICEMRKSHATSNVHLQINTKM